MKARLGGQDLLLAREYDDIANDGVNTSIPPRRLSQSLLIVQKSETGTRGKHCARLFHSHLNQRGFDEQKT